MKTELPERNPITGHVDLGELPEVTPITSPEHRDVKGPVWEQRCADGTLIQVNYSRQLPNATPAVKPKADPREIADSNFPHTVILKH